MACEPVPICEWDTFPTPQNGGLLPLKCVHHDRCDSRAGWLIDNECMTLCDTAAGYTPDEPNGRCSCADTTMYYSRDWDTTTGFVTGGSCKAMPNCTAGTGFLIHNHRCEHRRACNSRETWDEEKWDCVRTASTAGCASQYDLYGQCVNSCDQFDLHRNWPQHNICECAEHQYWVWDPTTTGTTRMLS